MFRVRSWWNLLLVLSCLFFASDHVLAQNVSSVASPQASVNDPVQANGRSKLALSLTIPFPVVAETMGKLPLIYREVGQHESCKLSVLPNCNYTYDLTFKRGPIAIAREHGAFKVTFPVSVHGDIRVRAIKGDSLPDSLRLFSRKTAGDVSVSLLIKLAVKDNWCPTWTVQPNLVWRKKPTIDLPLWGPMDLSEDIKSRVNEAFSIVGGDGAKDTACAAVRDKVTSLWTSNSDNPIKFEFMGSTYYFNTDPQRIGLFGVQVEEQRLRLGLTVEGGSSISSSPSKVRPPLPDRIDAITTVENHLEIDAPLSIPLPQLGEQLRTMVRSLTLPDHFSGFKLAVDKIETKHEGSGLLHTLYINLQHETSSHEIPGKIALRMVPAIDGASGTIAFDFPDRPLVIFDSLNSPNIFRASLGTAISKELAKLAKVPVAAPLITVLSRFEKEIQAVIKETGVAFELKDVDLRLKGPVTLDSEAMKVQVRLRASPYVAVDARVASWLGCSALEPDTNFLRDYTIMSDRLKADYPKADHLILRPRPADLSDSSATLPSVSLAEPLRVYDCVAVEGKDYKWCRVGSNTEKGWVNAFYLTPGKLRTCPM